MNQLKLDSERLVLRMIEHVDLDAIHTLHSLPETDAFNTLGIPNNREETRAIIEPWITDNRQKVVLHYTFAIVELKSNKLIGLIALNLWKKKYRRGEVWYKLHKEHWGKDFATEALNRLLKFCFVELKLHRVEAGCAVDNIASIRVLEKVGMIREGCKKKVLPLKSGWSDNFEYALLETDYLRR